MFGSAWEDLFLASYFEQGKSHMTSLARPKYRLRYNLENIVLIRIIHIVTTVWFSGYLDFRPLLTHYTCKFPLLLLWFLLLLAACFLLSVGDIFCFFASKNLWANNFKNNNSWKSKALQFLFLFSFLPTKKRKFCSYTFCEEKPSHDCPSNDSFPDVFSNWISLNNSV